MALPLVSAAANLHPLLPVQAMRPPVRELFRWSSPIAGDAGDDEILPNGEADFPAAELVGDVGKCEHLCDRHPANGC